jgi:hypothetical protein
VLSQKSRLFLNTVYFLPQCSSIHCLSLLLQWDTQSWLLAIDVLPMSIDLVTLQLRYSCNALCHVISIGTIYENLSPSRLPDVWEFLCFPRRRYALHATLPWTLAATTFCRSVEADRCLAATGTTPSCMPSAVLHAMQTCAASVRGLDFARHAGKAQPRPACRSLCCITGRM